MEALFSSLVGGERLRDRVLQTISAALDAGHSRSIDVHIMTFSFTDERIATVLKDVAARHANITIRVIADWGQGSHGAGRQVRDLARSGLPNLLVRYKRDQPYRWDASKGRMRWSYRTSRGLLHHKTLGIHLDGAPWALVCGSFNWTANATDSYENLLVVTAENRESVDLMRCVEWEFAAMWSDGRLTLSPDEARTHYLKILEEYRSDPAKAPSSIVGVEAGRGAALPIMDAAVDEASPAMRLVVAFSSRAPHDPIGERGYSPHNRARRFELYKPSGATKQVPLTLTALALDVIARATPGQTLNVAMYALSARVAEYNALLEAARRGVRLQILLDGSMAANILPQLIMVRERDQLPIDIRAGRRTMHQKYIVHPESQTVLTGTANLSTDSSTRHSEMRVLIRHNAEIAQIFLEDFHTIWERLPVAR